MKYYQGSILPTKVIIANFKEIQNSKYQFQISKDENIVFSTFGQIKMGKG
jgi:hypothetical protein